jgi:formiminoglutamase
MLENWFKPLDLKEDLNISSEAPWCFGNNISIFQEEIPPLQDTRIALIGIEEKDANAVREELYSMAFPFTGLKIADLGNIRKAEPSFMVAPLKELLNSRIFPLVIGQDVRYTMAIYQAFLSLQPWINLVTIDEQVRFDPKQKNKTGWFLNDIIGNRSYKLFHLGHVGAQVHFCPPYVFDQLERLHFDSVRLGKARANISELEPLFRDADLLSLHLAALKYSDVPAVAHPTPSGFLLEEACRIARYAGMSDKLKAMGIFGFQESLDRKAQTAQAIAQMIWYFIDGFHHRKNDFPVSTDGLVEYIVEFKKLEYQLTFWKSSKSGRWWMQIPVKSNKKYQRHRLLPCSYNDYKMACQEELPDRLLHALKRFT